VQLDVRCSVHRAMLCMRVICYGPVSVSLSDTSPCSTKTAKHRITQTSPHDSPGTLVFWCQISSRNSTGVIPYWGAKCRGGLKSATFDKKTGYISKTVQDRRMVTIKVEYDVVCSLLNGDIADDPE